MTAGTRFGRWSVLGDWITTEKGEKKYHCRCDCGTERYVLERSLKSGESLSCGCLARERASKARAYDLLGQTFGDLTVVGKSRKRTKMGPYWTCLCQCGYTCDATASELVSGRKTHCGCKSQKNYAYSDITGRRFGQLTALYPTSERSNRGSVVWHCRCDCGNETDAAYNDLMYANLKSCGCQKRAHEQELNQYLTHVDGTCIDQLKSKKIPRNNTTGVKGVYRMKGRYAAKIVFQKKQYFLGSYSSLEEAAKVRSLAEEAISDEVVRFYEKWAERAASDPDWASENPIQIKVRKTEQNDLRVDLLPELA